MSGRSASIMADDVLRLCLDTHLLVAVKFNKRSTPKSQSLGPDSQYGASSHFLMDFIENGGIEAAAIQLVVSWGMLNDLSDALESLGFSKASAVAIADGLEGTALNGPKSEYAHLVLGGTGLVTVGPNQQGVIETALAGRAHVLATNTVANYATDQTEVLERGERNGKEVAAVAIYDSGDRSIVIAWPSKVVGWLRAGIFPDAKRIRALYQDPPQPMP